MIEPLSTSIAVVICLPAIVMAANRSTWLIDYLFFVVALNRGIRRVVDYNVGEFNPYSFISLTPIVVGGSATLVVLIELNTSDNRFGRRALSFIIPYSLAVSASVVAISSLSDRSGAMMKITKARQGKVMTDMAKRSTNGNSKAHRDIGA